MISDERELRLVSLPGGGFVVSAAFDHVGQRPRDLAAFTDSTDLLSWLSDVSQDDGFRVVSE